MSVQVDVVYEGHLKCKATHGPSGAAVLTDAPTDNGGKGELFSPTDLVGTALGTCVLTILGLVADRNGWNLAGSTARVVKEMVATPVRRIGSLKTVVTVAGGAKLSPEDRTRLEAALEACPVKKSLHPEVAVPMEYVYIG
jgi:putative redox protein